MGYTSMMIPPNHFGVTLGASSSGRCWKLPCLARNSKRHGIGSCRISVWSTCYGSWYGSLSDDSSSSKKLFHSMIKYKCMKFCAWNIPCTHAYPVINSFEHHQRGVPRIYGLPGCGRLRDISRNISSARSTEAASTWSSEKRSWEQLTERYPSNISYI